MNNLIKSYRRNLIFLYFSNWITSDWQDVGDCPYGSIEIEDFEFNEFYSSEATAPNIFVTTTQKIDSLNWFVTGFRTEENDDGDTSRHSAINVQFRINNKKLQIKAIDTYYRDALEVDFQVSEDITDSDLEVVSGTGSGYGARGFLIGFKILDPDDTILESKNPLAP